MEIYLKNKNQWTLFKGGMGELKKEFALRNIFIAPEVQIGIGTLIGEWAEIGEGAQIGEGAEIGERAQIGEGAQIGKRAQIGEWAQIGERARIGEGAQIEEQAQIGERALIGKEAEIKKSDDVFVCGPQGSRNDMLTIYFDHKDKIIKCSTGCRVGIPVNKFRTMVKKTHESSPIAIKYFGILKYAEEIYFADKK